MTNPGMRLQPVDRWNQNHWAVQDDCLAVEEPLEIKVGYGPDERREYRSLAVTMRTPGHDFDLAAGFLLTEGIIGRWEDLRQMRYAGQGPDQQSRENVVVAELQPGLGFDPEQLSRHFYTSSSCGICGKASLDLIRNTAVYLLPPGRPQLDFSLLQTLPAQLQAMQGMFAQTGGMHAAALFQADGRLLLLREDVGRHNAMDKLVGAALHSGWAPLRDHLVVLSGRASFELVQKAIMVGIPFLAAVGAASTLAVDLAQEAGLTLVGFLREGRANVYCGKERLAGSG